MAYSWHRVLHLSDPHFGPMCCSSGPPKKRARKCIDELERALEQWGHELPFELVLLTGDIIWGKEEDKRAEGWEAGVEFVHLLLERKFALKEDAVVVLPGNHDIALSSLRDREDAEREYREFLQGAFKDERYKREDLGYEWVCPSEGLALIGLNSCRALAKETPSLGYVGYDQVWQQLVRLRGALQEERRPVVLAALHHHLHQLLPLSLTTYCQPARRWNLPVTSDAFEVLSALMRHGVALVLHGHTHLDYTYRYSHWTKAGWRCAPIAPVGSLFLSKNSRNIPRGNLHQFQIIEIPEEGDISLQVYQADLDERTPKWEEAREVALSRGPGWEFGGEVWDEDDASSDEKVVGSLDELVRLELYACVSGLYDGQKKATDQVLKRITERWLAKYGSCEAAFEKALPTYIEKWKSKEELLERLKTARLDDELLAEMRLAAVGA